MSKPRYKWWGYVKWAIRDYPDKKEELAQMQRTSMTANYNAMPHGSEASRTTERVALRGFAGQKQREYDGVVSAIDETLTRADGVERLRLIDLIFWHKTHTLEGAAMQCNVSYATAKNWHNDFIRMVAKYMDLF